MSNLEPDEPNSITKRRRARQRVTGVVRVVGAKMMDCLMAALTDGSLTLTRRLSRRLNKR